MTNSDLEAKMYIMKRVWESRRQANPELFERIEREKAEREEQERLIKQKIRQRRSVIGWQSKERNEIIENLKKMSRKELFNYLNENLHFDEDFGNDSWIIEVDDLIGG